MGEDRITDRAVPELNQGLRPPPRRVLRRLPARVTLPMCLVHDGGVASPGGDSRHDLNNHIRFVHWMHALGVEQRHVQTSVDMKSQPGDNNDAIG